MEAGGSEARRDSELVQAARRGDKRAFVEIVARHQAMVCGIAFGILNDFAGSEDAAQEAFLTAWRKIQELREPERMRPWLGQIARNAALAALRKRKGEAPIEEAFGISDEAPKPDESVVSDEEAALVQEALERLPEKYRVPLVLYYREGESVRAVAESMELSEDAVKQRLARGREMLREEIAGRIKSVLARTQPGAVFTMTIAAAIGALAAPSAVAAGVFSASAAASGTVSGSVFTAMSTSTKSFAAAAAIVAAVCVPVGYRYADPFRPAAQDIIGSSAGMESNGPVRQRAMGFENSALFAEWRALHEQYGTNAAAMPLLHKAISEHKDPFRRRAFAAAQVSEWVQVDPAGGLAFFLGKGRDSGQRAQFFEEWLETDAPAAVDALLRSGSGWESLGRSSLPKIARKVPARVPEIVARLPEERSFWDTNVRDAFAIISEGNIEAVRKIAENLPPTNRQQALAGVAMTWAKGDLDAAIDWAKGLPGDVDRDEVVRGALIGRAAVDPVSALDRVGLVPSGGKDMYFASTTGARVLREASKADFEGTLAWLIANPGRLTREDLLGVSEPVRERLNADPKGFLTLISNNNSFGPLLPAIESALLNDSAGQRAFVWEWLKEQPLTAETRQLRSSVLNSAGWQDPDLAVRLINELPNTAAGDEEFRSTARALFNGGRGMGRFEKLYAQASERLRPVLLEEAFQHLSGNVSDPQTWLGRIPSLPPERQRPARESLARAWAESAPEEAAGWARTLPQGEEREGAMMAVMKSWVGKDMRGVAEWIQSLPRGLDRDVAAEAVVYSISGERPEEALQWTLGIENPLHRTRAAFNAVQALAARDAAAAGRWLETAPLEISAKEKLRAIVGRMKQ